MGIFSGSGPQARIGIDIGSRFIKVAQIISSSHGIQLSALGISATPEGAIRDGVINDVEAVGDAIRQIVKFYKISDARSVCCVPGRASVIRQVTLPAGLSQKEVKVATIGEVERFLPFPLDEMEYDYNTLGEVEVGGAKQTSVLFVAAHKETINRRIESLKLGGLDSVEIDVEPFVLLRSIVESGLHDDVETFGKTLLTVDMGAGSTTVSIMKGGLLRFTRIFAIGGDMLTRSIESGMGISFQEAERLKKNRVSLHLSESALDPEAQQVTRTVRPHLETLGLEIRRSLAYYTSKYRGETVGRIILTGGASLLRGLNRFFEDDFGISTVYGNPLANIYYIGDEPTERVASVVPFMGVAVGLGLRQLPLKTLQAHCLNVGIDVSYEFGAAGQTGGATAA